MAVMFKNCCVTLYNKYYNKELKNYIYQRTVIDVCNWQSKVAHTLDTSKGFLNNDRALIFLNLDLANNLNREYISPKKFANLALADVDKYITLSVGDKIVKNECPYEWSKENPLANLEKNYDEVLDIETVKFFKNHIEIIAK